MSSTPPKSSTTSAKNPSSLSVTIEDIRSAQTRIAECIFRTPLTLSHSFTARFGRDIFIKWENKHRTGSFKERGAANFLLQLSPEEKKRGVCAASAGNHALAVAWHAKQLGIPCTIVMPVGAPLVKVKTTESFSARVSLVGKVFNDSYEHAMQLAEQENLVFVPGYNHEYTIAGAGVAGLEILEERDDIDCIVVPIGGGGLAAGIARAVRGLGRKDIHIIGVRSDWVERHKLHQGFFAPVPIADGIAVKEMGPIPRQIIESDVDEIITVKEQTIAQAIIAYLNQERTVMEGAGAAAMAALIEDQVPSKFERVVLLACGSNIDLNILGRLIQRSQFKNGQLVRIRVSVPDRPGSLARLTKTISEQSANVLETYHERSFSEDPGNVEITFLLETRDSDHKQAILYELGTLGLKPHEL